MALEQKIRDGKETLIYDIARPEDLDEAVLLVANSYSKSSPIIEIDSIGNPSNSDALIEWRKSQIQKCFAKPTSIIVREKSTNEMIAFVSMMILERNDHTNISTDMVDRSHPEWLIGAIEQELERDVDLYDRYGTDRILYVYIGVVRKDYRREKVLYSRAYMTLLDGRIIEKYAPGAMKFHAFSRFAGKGKLIQVIRSIDYDSFQLPDGTRPLAGINLGVHQTARLFAARLPFNTSYSIPASKL